MILEIHLIYIFFAIRRQKNVIICKCYELVAIVLIYIIYTTIYTLDSYV